MAKSIAPDVEEVLVDFAKFPRQPNQLIPILQYCQGQKGYISRATVNRISELLGISEAHGMVASFYTHPFRETRDHQVRICMGTACHVRVGSIVRRNSKIIGIRPDEISQDQNLNSMKYLPGLLCTSAGRWIDGKIHGKVTRKKLNKVLKGL
jgi:NADH-quinone oxidoreductase subunit E